MKYHYFLRMFNFQTSQLNQKELTQLADSSLKYPNAYATSNFNAKKIHSPLNLPLKPEAVFKNQSVSEVPIHLQDEINRLLNILEQNEIFSQKVKRQKELNLWTGSLF